MLTYQPDFVGETPEVLAVARGVIPINGSYMTSFVAQATAFTTAANGTVIGARAVKNDGGTNRLFVGSATKIQEYTSTGVTDRSKSGGYTNTAKRWWFSQGISANQVIATNGVDSMQYISATASTFLSLPNAPKAKIVVTQNEALLAMNYDDGTVATNGIKISDRGSATTWTAAVDNDAATVRLLQSPGAIVAGATFTDIVIAWKRESMYVGRFVGGDEKWQFNMISPYIGCYGMEAWAAVPGGVIFAGPAGVYFFDGSAPRPIDEGVRRTLTEVAKLDNNLGEYVQISHDEYSGCVFIWMPVDAAVGSTRTFECFAYSYLDGRWSRPYPMDATGASTAPYDFGHATVTGFQAVMRDFSALDYRAVLGTELTGPGHFFWAGDKKMYNLAGNPKTVSTPKTVSVITSGRIKAPSMPDTEMTLRRVYPLFGGETSIVGDGFPATSVSCVAEAYNIENYSRKAADSSVTGTWDLTNQRADVFATGKVFRVSLTGAEGDSFALKEVKYDVVPAGKK